MIGEFATVCSESHDSVKNFKYLYDSDYSGALAWQEMGDSCSDKSAVVDSGISAIAHLTTHGHIKVNI